LESFFTQDTADLSCHFGALVVGEFFYSNHCQFSLSIIILELLFEGFFAQSSLIFFMYCLAQSLPIFFMHCFAQSLSILLIFFFSCFAQSIDLIVLVIVIVKYAFHQACFVGSFLTNVI
jgi:hypothetical protein